MNEYLLRHAIANVWCNPAQDRQFVYRLARLSPRYGVRGKINLFYQSVPLPTPDEYYHIYQIGQITPKLMGLPNKTHTWIPLTELANDGLTLADLYLNNGIQFPRFESYLWITASKNLMVVVKINPRIHSLEDEDLYLRVYSNAYFNSVRSSGRRYLHCDGTRITSTNQLLAFQQSVLQLVNQVGGYPYYFVNGRFVHNISLVTAMVGDVVEYVIDGSIKRMVEFPIAGLPSFTSTLDAGIKYILHYDDPSVNTIEYLDDVEAFLYLPGINNRFMGIGYHRNRRDWLRMLTHKDYSIPSNRITSFVATHPTDPRHVVNPTQFPEDRWDNANQLVLRLYLRHSGYDRPLIAESNRIQELYRLDDTDIVGAMTGDFATLDLWRAENLEQSPYVRFMSADPTFVYPVNFNDPNKGGEDKVTAQEFAGDVYGYHAAATILAGTPSYTYPLSGQVYADLAFEHWYNATVYEYDGTGALLGHYYHSLGQSYTARNSACQRIEAITGRGGDSLNTHYGNQPVDIPYGHNHRVYVCPVWAGTPTWEWVDITESETVGDYGFLDITTTPHRWVWTAEPAQWYGAVRIDDRFLNVALTLRKANGHLRFNVTSCETHHGVEDWRVLDIPPGQFDLFLNGKALCEGLDYVVRWPEVVISNLEYLVAGDYQQVMYRGISFCDAQLQRLPTSEVGFVRHGVLSRDCEYDIFTHKVQRIVIDGRYFGPNDVVFDEQHNDLTVPGVRNGAPYFIQTPPTVFRDVYGLDQIARREDDERDQAVSQYMTEYFPPMERDGTDFIPSQYHVVSVFCNKLLHDIKEGVFYPDGMEEHYSDHQLRQWCTAYEWLLDYDIARMGYDEVFVQVWPHWFGEPIPLTVHQYQLYVRAVRSYLTTPPDLAPFIQLI